MRKLLIFMNNFDFEPIKEITWPEIWADWRALEEEHWRAHYQARGYKTWDEWRQKYWQSIKPESRIWSLMKIKNPKTDIPKFFVGPFRGWAKYYTYRDHSTFADIAKLRLETENEIPAKYFVNNFPASVRLIGLQFEDKIMIMEGTHRCLAVSILISQGKSVNFNIEIALTKLGDQNQELFNNLWNNPVQMPFENEL